MGGTGKIIKGFEKLMKEENIKIFKNSEVTNIVFDKNVAVGIKVKKRKNIRRQNYFKYRPLHLHINI